MFSAHTVEKLLNREGIKTLRVEISDDPTVEDDGIVVTEKISVQVGEDYLGVTKENDDETFTCYEATRDISKIARKLRELTV